jgi:membrane associated rhomboid family serine protease
VFPIGDELAPRRRPFVNWALIAACVAVYAYQVWLQEGGDQALIRAWGLVPARLLADPSGAWPTLLSHAFLHGSLLHLGGNMQFLWIFGDNVEDELGHVGYLLFYLAGGVLAGLASVGLRVHSDAPGIGASGAISAVLAAFLVLHPFAEVRVLVLLPWLILFAVLGGNLPIYGVPAWLVLGVWYAMQLVGGLGSVFSPSGVDYGAHIGGFAAGYLAIRGLRLLGFWPDEDVPAYLRPSTGPEAPASYVAARRRLLAGTTLDAADLQWLKRGHELVEPDAVPAWRGEQLLGRRLLVDHYPGEAIRWSDLEALAEGAEQAAGPEQLGGSP